MSTAADATRHASNRFEKLINIKDRGQIFRVDVDTIEQIDAAGDYMCIYTGDNTLILRETMKDLEKRLDPRRFQRVHRSTIVNLDQVRQVKPHTNGECFLVLDSRRAGEGQPLLSRRGGALRPLRARPFLLCPSPPRKRGPASFRLSAEEADSRFRGNDGKTGRASASAYH